MMCCPMSEADETASVYNESTPVARKEHRCEECRKAIPKGAKHKLVKMLYDGSWSTTRTCMLCVEIGDHFACGQSRIIGQLWSDLEESFFPDMKAGGPCMDGLSPEAKGRMFEVRTEWLLAGDADEYRVALPPGVSL